MKSDRFVSTHNLLGDRSSIHNTTLMTKQQKEQILKEMEMNAIDNQERNVDNKQITSKIVTSDDSESRVNFQRWVLILVSFASMILTATLIYLGFSSSGIIDNSMYAGKALFMLGLLACLTNALTIYATMTNRNRTLLLIVYIDFVLIAYLLIYSFGCITFQPNMQQWVYTNWEEIMDKVQKTSFVKFQQDIQNKILSLGVTAFTLSIGFAISIFFIVLRLHLKRILLTFVPAFAIMFMVFGSCLLWIAIYVMVHLDFIDIPFWMNTVSICVGGSLMLIGIIGYFASLFEKRKLTIFYLVCATLISLIILVCCLSYFILSNKIDFYVDQFWPQIREKLDRAGIWIPRSTFQSGLILNIKFSGLFGLTFFFFLSIGLAGSIYQVATAWSAS